MLMVLGMKLKPLEDTGDVFLRLRIVRNWGKKRTNSIEIYIFFTNVENIPSHYLAINHRLIALNLGCNKMTFIVYCDMQ